MQTKEHDKYLPEYDAIMYYHEWMVIHELIKTTHNISQTKNVGNWFIIHASPLSQPHLKKKFYVITGTP